MTNKETPKIADLDKLLNTTLVELKKSSKQTTQPAIKAKAPQIYISHDNEFGRMQISYY